MSAIKQMLLEILVSACISLQELCFFLLFTLKTASDVLVNKIVRRLSLLDVLVKHV